MTDFETRSFCSLVEVDQTLTGIKTSAGVIRRVLPETALIGHRLTIHSNSEGLQ